jgi:hypothetical protein
MTVCFSLSICHAPRRYGVVKPRWRSCRVSGKGVGRLRTRSRLFDEAVQRVWKNQQKLSAPGAEPPHRAVDVGWGGNWSRMAGVGKTEKKVALRTDAHLRSRSPQAVYVAGGIWYDCDRALEFTVGRGKVRNFNERRRLVQ